MSAIARALGRAAVKFTGYVAPKMKPENAAKLEAIRDKFLPTTQTITHPTRGTYKVEWISRGEMQKLADSNFEKAVKEIQDSKKP